MRLNLNQAHFLLLNGVFVGGASHETIKGIK